MNSLGLRSLALLSLLPIMASSLACSSPGATTGDAGTAGTMGAAGRGGSGGATGSAGATGAAGSQSVLERNRNPSRDGHFPQAALTKAVAATMAPTSGFTASFTGTMFASPLYLENGPGGKGLFFAVTTGNDVYALDETTSAIVWQKNIGSSPQDSGAGCGGIHPIGIESTPVIDAASRTIFVAGAIGTATISSHQVH